MIKIEKQVCSVDQAKKLKKLGIRQEAWFSFYVLGETGLDWLKNAPTVIDNFRNFVNRYDTTVTEEQNIIFSCSYSAYSVAELGIMLPKEYSWSWVVEDDTSGGQYWCCAKYNHGYEGAEASTIKKGTTEAEARAKMLIYLLEENIITKEKVNEKFMVRCSICRKRIEQNEYDLFGGMCDDCATK